MGTLRIKMLTTVALVAFGFTSAQGQNLFKKIKKKVEDKAMEKVEEELNKTEESKDQDPESPNKKERPSSSSMTVKKFELDSTFINYDDMIFYDDFQGEKVGEFPKKWLPISGVAQLLETEINGKEKVMVGFDGTSALKPRYKNENYLGESFKMEFLVYFIFKGNEQYHLTLKDGAKKRPYLIRVSAFGVQIGRDAIRRFSKGPSEGWRKVQLSFNQGTLKVFFDGEQLVNQPLLDHTSFTHYEFKSLNSRPGLLSYMAISKEGLPLYETLINEGKLVVQDINFKVNSYEIESGSYAVLDEIVAMMAAHPEIKVSIEGHTDADGSATSNQTLSENRAQSVKAYLVSKDIDPSRLTSKGYGESKPLDESGTAAGKRKNRRVEFVLQ